MADKTALDQQAAEIVRAALLAHVGPANACIVSSLTDTAFSALADAGYSVVKIEDEWEYGVTEPLDNDRVYDADLFFGEYRIQLRRMFVERDGADPSTVPVLMRRRKLAPLPWEPVPEGGDQWAAKKTRCAAVACGAVNAAPTG